MREDLAAISHEIWSHWMRYLFSCCEAGFADRLIIPSAKVKHWRRQMDTPYSELSERERESDREQADKILKVIELRGGA